MTLPGSTPPQPEPQCWLHPDIEIRPSPIADLGLFARADIAAGTVISRLGGRLVTGSELRRVFAEAAQQPGHPYVDTITVDVDLHLAMPPGQPNHYGNHSCDPNGWWTDAYTLAARRDITAGEEVTSDYATSSGADDFSMPCSCKSPLCRNIITSTDWRLPELQARYGDHWVPALLARIQRA